MKIENDKYFPAGRMRVLAVDDNSTCLIVLEALLRKCQYNVTTIKEATKALQILRENKNEFDLVISEVHLPDMDAFKLLEEVTLQMDIPVVLVSSDDDKERVIKGITYGACDYLLKPVRIEELKNIWQHVVRRKINKCDKAGAESVETSINEGTDSSVCKKRKEQVIKEELEDEEEEDYDDQEKGQQREEELPPKQKKPRVVWLPELHRKFVAAVDQMGVDKAVPKRILELMNVEGITRENVASHLQKYRMFLKKSNGEANPQQANNTMLSFGSAAYYGQVDNRQIISRQCKSSSYPAAASTVLMSSSGLNVPPASHHLWGHSDNNSINTINDPNNNIHYSSSIMHTMNNQSHEQMSTGGTPMPIAMFDAHINVVDDFSINCDFADNNLMLEVDHHLSNATMPANRSSADQADSLSALAQDFSSKLTNFERYNNNNWPTSVCHGQQGPSPSTNFYLPTSTTSAAAHLVISPSHLSSADLVLPITHNMNYNSTPSWSILRREFPKNNSCLLVDHMNCEGSDPDGTMSRQLNDAQNDSSGLEAREQASSEPQQCTKSDESG